MQQGIVTRNNNKDTTPNLAKIAELHTSLLKILRTHTSNTTTRHGTIYIHILHEARTTRSDLTIYAYSRYALVLAPDREFCESEVRGKYREPLHLLMVRAGNSFDPGPVWLMQEAERGAQ